MGLTGNSVQNQILEINYQNKASGCAATGSAEFDTNSKGCEPEQEWRKAEEEEYIWEWAETQTGFRRLVLCFLKKVYV